jgi:hypothetical protein
VRYALILLAACSTAPRAKLPGAEIAPQLEARTPSEVCATDIAFTESGRVDLRYRYSYDDLGRIAFAKGTYTTGVTAETLEYDWDNLDHMVHLVEAAGKQRYEVIAQYNTLGDLLDYTAGGEHHVYSELSETGLPTRETINGFAYRIEYDATNRVTRYAPEDGSAPTIYTYDDEARTVTVDTDNGAYRGLVTYDEANHELSEHWDGTAEGVIARDLGYAWDGDRLQAITMRMGTDAAPHALVFAHRETYSYRCD